MDLRTPSVEIVGASVVFITHHWEIGYTPISIELTLEEFVYSIRICRAVIGGWAAL